MNEIRQNESTSSSFAYVIQNHDKLVGSKTDRLHLATSALLTAFKRDSGSILGPICEQLTRTVKKSRRLPYLNVSEWLHQNATAEFDSYLVSTITAYTKDTENKRQVMGCCILIRSLAITTCFDSLITPMDTIMSRIQSDTASHFEMELFNTAVFMYSSLPSLRAPIQRAVDVFTRWMKHDRQIAFAAASFISTLEDVSGILPRLRTDIPVANDFLSKLWSTIMEHPFESEYEWIVLGVSIGRLPLEEMKDKVAILSSDPNQVPSVISVCIACDSKPIRTIARAFLRATTNPDKAGFDPSTLGSLLSQSDEMTDITLAFLSEMTIANPQKCLPQLFPLLKSDEPIGRKNAISLFSLVCKADPGEVPMRMIAESLLPMVGDEALSVRLNIPEVLSKAPLQTVVKPLSDMVNDKDEKVRSNASVILKSVLSRDTQALEMLLSCNLTPKLLSLIEVWSKEQSGKFLIDPSFAVRKLWEEPSNQAIVSFIAKASPVFNPSQTLSLVLERLRETLDNIYDKLAPLLVLRCQPLEFFTTREVSASNLLGQLFSQDESERAIQRVRGEIIARFNPSLTIPLLREKGLTDKFILYIICISGQLYPGGLKDLGEELEALLKQDVNEESYRDALWFVDRERYLRLAFSYQGREFFVMLSSAFRKFEKEDCQQFIQSGGLVRTLGEKFIKEDAADVVNTLFIFAFKSKDLDLGFEWETLFDLACDTCGSNDQLAKLNGLKLIGALIANAFTESHLMGAYERLMKTLTDLSQDVWSEDVRKLAENLLDSVDPRRNLIRPE